jgi:DNA-binding MarR family transcriptional regulator
MNTESEGWEIAIVERLLPRSLWYTDHYYVLSYLIEDKYDQSDIALFLGLSQPTVSRIIERLRKITSEQVRALDRL